METNKLYASRNTIFRYILLGAFVGVIVGLLEYLFRFYTQDKIDLLPLLLRAVINGSAILCSITIFDILFEHIFAKKKFAYIVFVKALSFTIIISFWLIAVNTTWLIIHFKKSFYEGLVHYIFNDTYFINLISVFIVLVIGIGLYEVNGLHRKGELVNFLLGKYHQPREVNRIFCFIDLIGSTTIAEKLGHLDFAMFLKDYYADITKAIKNSKAQIYQYVGDEIVLSWSYEEGLQNNNAIMCLFDMKDLINHKKQDYITKYGVYPEFRGGAHCGKVIVTWIGELKKEIVYIGDTINTASRIRSSCAQLNSELLISAELLQLLHDVDSDFEVESVGLSNLKERKIQ